jgi:hypothetical protein
MTISTVLISSGAVFREKTCQLLLSLLYFTRKRRQFLYFKKLIRIKVKVNFMSQGTYYELESIRELGVDFDVWRHV